MWNLKSWSNAMKETHCTVKIVLESDGSEISPNSATW